MKEQMEGMEHVETFPSEENIRDVFEFILKSKDFKEVKKIEDGQGLYQLDVEGKGEDGLPLECSYRRDGSYVITGEEKKRVPAIDITFLDEDGMPTGGTTAKFVEESWE